MIILYLSNCYLLPILLRSHPLSIHSRFSAHLDGKRFNECEGGAAGAEWGVKGTRELNKRCENKICTLLKILIRYAPFDMMAK